MFAELLKRAAPTAFAERYKMGHDFKFHLFEARRGRGKSYTLTVWALECLRKGIPVTLNYELDLYFCALQLKRMGDKRELNDVYTWLEHNVRFAQGWDDVFTSYDRLVILDECNRTFRAGAGREDAPSLAYEWLQQSRKFRQTIIFAAQGFDWLPPRVRQLADTLWRSKRVDTRASIVAGKRVPKEFWIYGGDPWEQGLNKTAQRSSDWVMFTPFDMRVARCYLSYKPVGGLSDVPSFGSMWDYYSNLQAQGVIPYWSYSGAIDDQPLGTLERSDVFV